MGEGNKAPKNRSKQHDDVPRSPPGKRHRSVKPDEDGEDRLNILEASRLVSADDVLRYMKRH